MPNFPKKEHFLPCDMHTYVCLITKKLVQLVCLRLVLFTKHQLTRFSKSNPSLLYARPFSFKVKYLVPLDKVVLTYFSLMFHFSAPKKRQKTLGFLPFLGGLEMKHWVK